MRVADFTFELPDSLIARHPLAERRASRLLTLDGPSGALAHRQFTDLLEHLRPGLTLRAARADSFHIMDKGVRLSSVLTLGMRAALVAVLATQALYLARRPLCERWLCDMLARLAAQSTAIDRANAALDAIVAATKLSEHEAYKVLFDFVRHNLLVIEERELDHELRNIQDALAQLDLAFIRRLADIAQEVLAARPELVAQFIARFGRHQQGNGRTN